MQIAQDKVVLIHYTLTNDKGEVIDSSSGGEPLAYLHGQGNIIAGLFRFVRKPMFEVSEESQREAVSVKF